MNEKIKDFIHTLEETHNFIHENRLKNNNHSVNSSGRLLVRSKRSFENGLNSSEIRRQLRC